MRLVRSAEAGLEPPEPDHFTGTNERRALGLVHPGGVRGGAILVTFRDGGRTNWHSHASGQLLFVVEGRGRVGTRDRGEIEIGAGDFIEADAGEEHWHGAAPGADLTHFAVSFGETSWGEAAE